MIIKSNNDYQEVNRYLKKFILSNEASSFDEIQATIFKKIHQLDEVPFNSDWNYLMILVQRIEEQFGFDEFVSESNYFRFQSGNSGEYQSIQDKQPTKMEAIYSCCVLAVKEYWKEGKAIPYSRGGEPFDINDL